MKKKHIIALACVLALAVSLLSSFAFAATPEETVQPREHVLRVVKQASLYKKATTSSAPLVTLPVNTIVYQESTTITNGFYYVRAYVGGTTYYGYVHGNNLSGIS